VNKFPKKLYREKQKTKRYMFSGHAVPHTNDAWMDMHGWMGTRSRDASYTIRGEDHVIYGDQGL